MITKIRKYQDSWATKAILALTALSFMSLFGISSYVSSAGKNRAVIKVDDKEILQDEMNVKLQNSIRKAQNMFGDAIVIDDNMRKNILSDLVKRDATNMIIARAAEKEGASISDDLIKKIIASQPEFMDASGRFNPEILRRQLSYFDMGEQEYVEDLKRNVLSRHLVYSPVEKIAFPQFMNQYVAQIENQQKIFNYITVNPHDMKIDRSISEEEIEQYYQDFAPQFEEPEQRDVSFVELKTADLSRSIKPRQDEIKAYYDENVSDYVIPEKRKVLQMVFDTEEAAADALKRLKKGSDFYQVADAYAHQDKTTTNLGDVSADSLLPELSEDVFDAKLNQVVGPINSEFGWHILKIVQITPKKETPLSAVQDKIVETLRQEQAYDQALKIMNDIEDQLGAGASLQDIAKKYKTKIQNVKGLKEDGSYASLSRKEYAGTVASGDFLEAAFSYNENEVSQTIETEDGFVLTSVDRINDAHIKDLKEVKPEIVKIWTENEKSAIAQEVVNDIVANLDNGDGIGDIAARFNLKLNTTKALKRGEKFANLNAAQLTEAYQTPVDAYKILTAGSTTSVVVPVKVINYNKSSTKQQQEAINAKMQNELAETAASELIDAYAKDMDVRIKYRLLGLED